MRRLLVLALLLAMLPPPATADHGGIHISEILPRPLEGQREFVELWNDGPDMELAGWTLQDSTTSNVFTFPAWTLPTGGRMVVWTGGEGDARGPAWSASSIWNDGGDQVILRDAANNTLDVFAYGSASWPDSRADPVPGAPPQGSSLSLRDGVWMESSPTPGSVAKEHEGDVSATVEDVPPTATFTSAPGTVEPGASFTVAFEVDDANGGADVASWSLTGDGLLLENGTSAGAFAVPLSAPTDRDRWHLVLDVLDQAGQQGNDTLDVLIEAAGLSVVIPDGGISFPGFPPGADEVLALSAFTMRNDGQGSVTPRIDISDLSGPAAIALEGRLEIGYESNTTAWTAYEGPLTPLPALAPGESVDVRLRLSDLPTPLPAGQYGTSFAVIA